MRAKPPLWIAAGLVATTALAWWLWPRGQELLQPATEGAESPPPVARAPGGAPQELRPAGPSAPVAVAPKVEPEAAGSDAHDHAEPEAPAGTEDLLLYARRPMSATPHRVLRGWGASDDPSNLGLVGAYVIVDPGMSDQQLIQLCRDVREYHRDAKALSVRILDSEDAATYDRHVDGGAYKDQHQVATVTRDPKHDVDEIRVRGEIVKP
jgi:hypothetical protein